MKKTVPFEAFAPNQYIYFDITRLAELEAINGEAITATMKKEAGISFCLAGLRVGLKHHYHKATPAFYAEKIEEYLDNGGNLEDIAVPIIRAIILSGIFGKELTENAEKELDKVAGEQTDEKNG